MENCDSETNKGERGARKMRRPRRPEPRSRSAFQQGTPTVPGTLSFDSTAARCHSVRHLAPTLPSTSAPRVAAACAPGPPPGPAPVSTHPMLSLVLVALAATLASGQSTCSNYGTSLANGTCQCPPGFSPASGCTAPTCENPLVPAASRQVFSAVLSGNASAGCAQQCSDGFSGPTCGVCTTDASCASALNAVNGASSSSSSGMSLTNGLGTPVCSRGAWTWTEGFGSCDVVVRAQSLSSSLCHAG